MSVPFHDVLKTEHQHVRQRRGASITPAAADPVEDAHHLKPFGVAFSGGGIRSATFNLGIIQGLAESNLLSSIDYLSTVSGGGYIGSWLHGFIRHEGDLEKVSARLSPTDNPVPDLPHDDPVSFLRKYSNYLAPRPGLFGADTWVIGSIWLRNVLLNQLILIPSLGAVMLAAFLFYFVQQWRIAAYTPNIPYLVMPLIAVLLLASTLPVAIRNLSEIVRRCALPYGAGPKNRGSGTGSKTGADPWLAPVLIFVAAVVLGTGDTGARIEESILESRNGTGLVAWLQWSGGLGLLGGMFFALFFVLQTFGGFRRQYQHTHKGMWWTPILRTVHPMWMSAVSAALLVLLLHLLWTNDASWPDWRRITVGPPLVSAAIMVSISLLIGLMGADYPDGAREWLARSGALLALASAGWLVLFGMAFYGPWAVAYALGSYGKTTAAAIVAWIGTGAAGMLAGRSSRTNGPAERGKSSPLDWLVGIAPPLVMIGYLLLVSLGAHQVFAATLTLASPTPEPPAREALQVDVRVPPPAEPVEITINRSALGPLDNAFAAAKAFAGGYYRPFEKGVDVPGRLARVLVLFFGCLAIASIASARININEFSLHNFYKNRLVRCYLGASNAATRQPNRLTGFDPQDDFPLSELIPEGPDRPYRGPYPIVNTTLNLNVGSELSQQERKGASFVMTPAFCGFDVRDAGADMPDDKDFEEHGYRQTKEGGGEKGYSDPNGPTIGQAMAISGAAASPNAGYTTSGPMAFLLTIFDGRLGWWLGNPRWKSASRQPGPSFALKYLLAELTANTTARTRFVNLSDGGHFENLGLYELVRRRCRYIVVGDGEQDGQLTFGSLGGAVRKCRADFGVEIDIDPTPIKITNGRSEAHCVIGTIVYPEKDPTGAQPMAKVSASSPEKANYVKVQPATDCARGWILYLKSSLTGNEPADVLQYQAENPEFPHQSTGDQFFSESQFESYRRLGLHIIREAFEGVLPPRVPGEMGLPTPPDLTALFQSLTMKWYATIPIEASAASRLNDSYATMMSRLGEQDLKAMLDSALAGITPPAWQGTQPSEAQFVFIVEQLQLMENVFFEFHFEHRAHRANPRSRGWMTVFRQWAHNPMLYDGVWPRVKHSYNPVFQDFIDRLHNEKIDDVPIQN